MKLLENLTSRSTPRMRRSTLLGTRLRNPSPKPPTPTPTLTIQISYLAANYTPHLHLTPPPKRMDLLASIRKEGSRGGRANFKWEDVQNDQHRENYLGHSLKARKLRPLPLL